MSMGYLAVWPLCDPVVLFSDETTVLSGKQRDLCGRNQWLPLWVPDAHSPLVIRRDKSLRMALPWPSSSGRQKQWKFHSFGFLWDCGICSVHGHFMVIVVLHEVMVQFTTVIVAFVFRGILAYGFKHFSWFSAYFANEWFALWWEFVLGDFREDSPTMSRVWSIFLESEIFGFGSRQRLTLDWELLLFPLPSLLFSVFREENRMQNTVNLSHACHHYGLVPTHLVATLLKRIYIRSCRTQTHTCSSTSASIGKTNACIDPNPKPTVTNMVSRYFFRNRSEWQRRWILGQGNHFFFTIVPPGTTTHDIIDYMLLKLYWEPGNFADNESRFFLFWSMLRSSLQLWHSWSCAKVVIVRIVRQLAWQWEPEHTFSPFNWPSWMVRFVVLGKGFVVLLCLFFAFFTGPWSLHS